MIETAPLTTAGQSTTAELARTTAALSTIVKALPSVIAELQKSPGQRSTEMAEMIVARLEGVESVLWNASSTLGSLMPVIRSITGKPLA